MTTFFRTGSGRQVVDTWSTRVASFRTADVLSIFRIEEAVETELGSQGLRLAVS